METDYCGGKYKGYVSDYKVYVAVNADFTSDGQILPRSLVWTDGTRYEIDKVLTVKRCCSLKAGGMGERFTVRIEGKQTYLFYGDEKKWFVESKRKINERR